MLTRGKRIKKPARDPASKSSTVSSQSSCLNWHERSGRQSAGRTPSTARISSCSKSCTSSPPSGCPRRKTSTKKKPKRTQQPSGSCGGETESLTRIQQRMKRQMTEQTWTISLMGFSASTSTRKPVTTVRLRPTRSQTSRSSTRRLSRQSSPTCEFSKSIIMKV